MQAKENLEKMKDKVPLNHPMRPKLDEQLIRLRAKTVLLFLVLMD